ncbi:hypothetical protein RRG08_060749 [Elysia crispata]|uniref:Uncharacterized protein n=1 Tax=Elysia crispata TaxID=231223 RepID=A0AAE0YG09_9GAST|nr:hypothetical protein RRG08_060749 [Elysia crispata]
MGRRARTNCSPVDSVLEKYHNDIGNRLSGIFIPPPTAEGDQALSEDFSMLTLDLRRAHSVKVKGTKGDLSAQTVLKNSLITETAGKRATDTTPKVDPTRSATMPKSIAFPAPGTSSNSEVEGVARDKTRLVDKLTRALFQKKHVCARCNRKSRSCVLNKTFNASEKRYTCGRCRENSNALKNFFDGQTGAEENQNSSFSSLSSSSFTKRDGSGVSQLRAGNDSGYETVTSCSTVASSYSAFNTPNSNNTSRKENLAPGCETRLTNPQELSVTTGQDCQTSTPMTNDFQQRCQCQTGESDCSQFNTAEDRVPRLPGQHAYDGFLPDFIEFRGWTRELLRPCSQGDAASADCGDDAITDSGPGIICVRRPASLDSCPKPARKACHTCGTTSVPCFRLPWEGGWLCEDCMDGIY